MSPRRTPRAHAIILDSMDEIQAVVPVRADSTKLLLGFVCGIIVTSLVWGAFQLLIFAKNGQKSTLSKMDTSTVVVSNAASGTPHLPLILDSKQTIAVDTFLSEHEMESLVAMHKIDAGFFTTGTLDESSPNFPIGRDASSIVIVIPKCNSTREPEGPGDDTTVCDNDVYLRVSNKIDKAFAKIYTFNSHLQNVSYSALKANANMLPDDENTPSEQSFILSNGYMKCCDAAKYTDSWYVSYSASNHTTTIYRLDPMGISSTNA